jgi:hypothetical protein
MSPHPHQPRSSGAWARRPSAAGRWATSAAAEWPRRPLGCDVAAVAAAAGECTAPERHVGGGTATPPRAVHRAGFSCVRCGDHAGCQWTAHGAPPALASHTAVLPVRLDGHLSVWSATDLCSVLPLRCSRGCRTRCASWPVPRRGWQPARAVAPAARAWWWRRVSAPFLAMSV